MKISPTLRHRISQIAAKNIGFTLIELLVVIAIIAVLAGMLFPAMGGVRNAARKTSAKNDVVQIVNAVRNYYVEYGKYPTSNGTTEKADNPTLFNILRGITTTENARQIRFLEVKESAVGAVAADVKSAIIKSSGVWNDPWARPYVIFVDMNYDGKVSSDVAGAVETDIQTGVIAASLGKPKEGTSGKDDPVCSWK